MKKIILLLLVTLPLTCFCQPKLFNKHDIAPMILTFSAGHLNGWREEVLYHPNQLFARFPGLNRPFWDIRVQDEPGIFNTEIDADHVLEAGSKFFMVAAVAVKIGEKKKWYWYLVDVGKYMLSYKFGEFTSYHLIHGNKVFK